jgi:hypothetical protein
MRDQFPVLYGSMEQKEDERMTRKGRGQSSAAEKYIAPAYLLGARLTCLVHDVESGGSSSQHI